MTGGWLIPAALLLGPLLVGTVPAQGIPSIDWWVMGGDYTLVGGF